MLNAQEGNNSRYLVVINLDHKFSSRMFHSKEETQQDYLLWWILLHRCGLRMLHLMEEYLSMDRECQDSHPHPTPHPKEQWVKCLQESQFLTLVVGEIPGNIIKTWIQWQHQTYTHRECQASLPNKCPDILLSYCNRTSISKHRCTDKVWTNTSKMKWLSFLIQ